MQKETKSSNENFGKTIGAIAAGLTLGAIGVKEYYKKEPIQYVLPLSTKEKVYNTLLKNNFKSIGWGSELVRYGKVFSVAKTFENRTELHVRAIMLDKDNYYLSAHMDFGPRHSIRHLKGLFASEKESYANGAKILRDYLPFLPEI